MINVGFIGSDLNVNQKVLKRKLKDILGFGILQPNYNCNFNFITDSKDNLGEIVDTLKSDFKDTYNIKIHKLQSENIYNNILNNSDIIIIYDKDKDNLLDKLKLLNKKVILVIINTNTFGFITKEINEL